MNDGAFIEATPMEGTILLNIGLLLEMWTNGRLRATHYRIVQATSEARVSMAFFVCPDESVIVRPMKELKVYLEEPDRYDAYHPAELFQMVQAQLCESDVDS